MGKRLLDNILEELCGRVQADGGFAEQPGGTFRPESTAWAILALRSVDNRHDLVEAARTRLVAAQLNNGLLPASVDTPDALWPTPLAVLAWHGSPKHKSQYDLAVDKLLKTSGRHPKQGIGASTNISHGWPWIDGTHSWVVPTSLAILALTIAANSRNKRIIDGVDFLMGLQLPAGGWNYGNTVVFDQELLPQVDCTGIALAALAGHVPQARIQRSLDYLAAQVPGIRTPLSLCWGLIGLGAWGAIPAKAPDLIAGSYQLQQKYGPFGTTLLSLLMVAYVTNGNIAALFTREGESHGSA